MDSIRYRKLLVRSFGGVLAGLLLVGTGVAGGTKMISGKLRNVKDNVLTIERKGLLRESLVDVEMDAATKITGQIAPGMHAKVKYREESDPGKAGQTRRIAVEVETWPEFASKTAKEAAKQTRQ